ncbi:PulJ/GspJ family protein [Gimesia sp.]|uniref:PulJ/GspJ family protein n=1 Tax=Gimesia sp. TaxID=2024833 RepID=UPI003A8F9D12
MQRRGFHFSIRQYGCPPGISLVEVVVAMGIASVLMGISMTTMHTVLQAERETSKAAWLGSSFQRFSHLLRADIHAAVAVRFPAEGGAEITLQQPDNQSVTYRIDQHQIFRVVTSQGKEAHRDVFYLPEGSHARFFEQQRLHRAGISIEEPDPLQRVLNHKKNQSDQSGRPAVQELSIISTIGHDYRLADLKLKQPEIETNKTE